MALVFNTMLIFYKNLTAENFVKIVKLQVLQEQEATAGQQPKDGKVEFA